MQFRIGVLGATGYIGEPYRREIRESNGDVQIVALCARRRDRLEKAGVDDAILGTAPLLSDQWQDVVGHPEVNLVLVLTPDALHSEPVLAAAAAGKHVLCEKPIGKDSAEARIMWEAVEKADVASFVPYWTRYVPAFRRAKEIYDRGDLGTIQSVIYRWHNPRPLGMPFTWRDNAELSSAGSIADVGSHAYDTMRFILGEEARRVLTHAKVVMPPKPHAGDIDLNEAIALGENSSQAVATGSDQSRRGTVPDYAQIAVEFESGAVGGILLSHASYIRKGFAPELELHGTKASISVDRIRNEIWFADSPEPARPMETLGDGYCNRFQQHVFPALEASIANAQTDHPNMLDGLRVQLFTDAAFASSHSGGWVTLDR